MGSMRPTTRGTGMTAFSSPTSFEDDDEGGEGMFSYLPPSTSQGGPPSVGSFQVGHQLSGVTPMQPLVPLLLRSDSQTQPMVISTSDPGSNSAEQDLEKLRSPDIEPDLSLSDPNAHSIPQLRRELMEGFTVGKHHHPPKTATTIASMTASPVIELNERMKLARVDSAASVGSEKVEKNRLQVPGTAISMTYSQAMAQLDELDPEEEDSPYPEVRASVSNIDDPDMPALTFRVWFLGILFSVLIAAANQFLSFRQPSIFLTPVIVIIASYPLGKLMARILPTRDFATPKIFQMMGMGEEWSFNPGPFNIKEHTIITIMANTANGQPYALLLSVVLDKFYEVPKGIGFDVLMVLSSQIIGFSFAGLARRFLVRPASMIWPSNLVYCTLFNTFHAEDDDGSDGSITRYRYFSYLAVAAGVWWFLPGYLFTSLSFFSWICWIAPTNVVVNQVFGVVSGLGASMLTFDWTQISYIGSPFVTPWWAEVNVFVGFIFFLWFLTPIFYYTNLWFFAYLPIATTGVYDRYGNGYNISAVLEPDGITFDEAGYQAYSPLYLPVSYVSIYSIAFCLSTAVLIHTLLYHGKSIWLKLRSIRDDDDVHAKLMNNYREVPNWWYTLTLGLTFLMAVIVVEVWNTGLPVWALMIAIAIAAIYVLPAGIVFAQTSLSVPVNIVAEVIPGYIFPGQPIAVMIFKVFVIQGLNVAINFVQDLKLGHYMKIAPRITFTTQFIAMIASSLMQIGIKQLLETSVDDLCSPDQAGRLVCAQQHTFFSSSILWGVVGPARQFSPGALYHPLVYWALIGALLPIPFWLLARRFPQTWVRYINIPVMLTGCTLIPAATGFNYSSWFLVAFITQYLIRRRNFRWWSKFNFITSAGLDAGTLVSAIIIFCCLELPKDGNIQVNWWGNDVWQNTADYNVTSYLTIPADGFGPSSGWT